MIGTNLPKTDTLFPQRFSSKLHEPGRISAADTLSVSHARYFGSIVVVWVVDWVVVVDVLVLVVVVSSQYFSEKSETG